MHKEIVQKFLKKLNGHTKNQQLNILYNWVKKGDIQKAAIFRDILESLYKKEDEETQEKENVYIEFIRLKKEEAEEEQRKRDQKKLS